MKSLVSIVRWTDGAMLHEVGATDLKDAAQQLVAVGADLRGADLRGADLRDADLGGADLGGADLRGADLRDASLVDACLRGAKLGESARLPTGETWDEYLTEVVPALLKAGGQSLESFAPHWTCYDWSNCPMAHAFGAKDLMDVPVLFRPRVEQFIQLFDAGQIPWPLPTKAVAHK